MNKLKGEKSKESKLTEDMLSKHDDLRTESSNVTSNKIHGTRGLQYINLKNAQKLRYKDLEEIPFKRK